MYVSAFYSHTNETITKYAQQSILYGILMNDSVISKKLLCFGGIVRIKALILCFYLGLFIS